MPSRNATERGHYFAFSHLTLAEAPDELRSQLNLSTCPGDRNSSNAIAGGLLLSRSQQCLLSGLIWAMIRSLTGITTPRTYSRPQI